MKERPILFSAPMIRAILDGRKTMTRRIMKPQPFWPDGPSHGCWYPDTKHTARSLRYANFKHFMKGVPVDFSRYGVPGDRLWVRETWRRFNAVDECGHADFPCSCPPHGTPLYRASHDDGESKWTPSIHMPRAVSRILLEVTAIRVQRLQAISEEDAVYEGCRPFFDIDNFVAVGNLKLASFKTARDAFCILWNSINGKRPGCTWDDNPWVWVVEFQRV